MFWDPEEETRNKNMIAIIKIVRELGLYKDSYNHSTSSGDEEEQISATNSEQDGSRAPKFLGDTTSFAFIPKRRRSNDCEQSLESFRYT